MDSKHTTPPSLKEQQMSSNNFQKFHVLKLNEGSFASISPFLIHKTIHSIIGEVKSVKKLRSGDLLIEVVSAAQACNISKIKTIGSNSVTASPHTSLNTSRGVISESELLNVTETEIQENLKEQNVVNVRRITIRRDGKILPTKHLILTFNTSSLPSHIRAGYIRCPVRPYIPNPLRCFKCQRFGHSKDSCRGSQTCARCSQTGHESDSCTGVVKCVNCKGDHPAYSRSCSKWALEKEIQTIKVTQNISFSDARRIVNSRTPTIGVSFSAAVASKKVTSIGTQTDINWPNISNISSHSASQTNVPKVFSISQEQSNKKISETSLTTSSKISKLPSASASKPKRTNKKDQKSIKSKHIPATFKKQRDARYFLKKPNPIKEAEEDAIEIFASDLSDGADNIEFMDVPPSVPRRESELPS